MRSKATTHRDRMLEFQNISGRLQKPAASSSLATNGPTSSSSSVIGTSTGTAQPWKSVATSQYEFSRRAARIGLAIHQTSKKLSQLAKLAKSSSVFVDPTAEIQELTSVIKQDITALNSAIVDLLLLSNFQNDGRTSSDSAAHSVTVVDNLKNSLMSTTKEFKEVLTKRTENLKVHQNRKQLFSFGASKETTNPFVRQLPLVNKTSSSAEITPPPWASGAGSSSQLFPRSQGEGESQPLLQQQQRQQQQQMVPLQDTYKVEQKPSRFEYGRGLCSQDFAGVLPILEPPR